MDIDMLGRTINDLPGIADQMREILSVAQTDDGVVFEPEALRTERQFNRPPNCNCQHGEFAAIQLC